VQGSDTVPDYDVDNGADLYINMAVRWWDEKFYIERMQSVALSVDAYELTLPDTLLSVEYMALDDQQDPLTAVNERWMREAFGVPFSGETSETPLYWCFKGGSDAGSANKTIYIMPPNDISRNVLVYGHFREAELVDNADTNWWTLNHWDKVLFVAVQLALDLDLNPDGNSTLQRLLYEVQQSIVRHKVYNEVSVHGTVMRG
jgi:hypothetical protein